MFSCLPLLPQLSGCLNDSLLSSGEYLFEVTAVTSFMMLLILFPLLHTPFNFPHVFNCYKIFKKLINLEIFF